MTNGIAIVADIGGTNARFAWVNQGETVLQDIIVFPSAGYPHLEGAIRTYIKQTAVNDVNKICLAVAGPVTQDKVDLPNNHWAFSCTELEASLDIQLQVINDFTAQALCLDDLNVSELFWVDDKRPQGDRIKSVIGPGTGLGVAISTQQGEIIPSEAGHTTFAPSNKHELELLKVLWSRYPRVSVERLLSGPGLSSLYWSNAQLHGEDRELNAPEVVAGANAGDALCIKAIEDFFLILASVAGDLALTAWSEDGVYFSGGILPRILNFLNPDSFRNRFADKGRFREFCLAVPLAVIQADQPGLRGCAMALKIAKT